jgi:phospholipid-translocating ATPase
MNFGKYDLKMPRFEKLLNLILVINFAIMAVLTAILVLGNHLWNSKNYDRYGYIFQDGPSAAELTSKVVFSFWLMLNSLMPLELECCL